MEPDALELTRAAFAALARGDVDAFLEQVDPDIEFSSLVAEADTDVFHGHDGVHEWWTMVRGSIGGMRFDVEDLTKTENERVVIAKMNVVGEVAGTEVAQRMWQVVYVPGGKAVWWGVYRTEEEAREAGLAAAAARE